MDFLLQNRVERRRAHRHKSLVLYLFYSIRKKKNYPINDIFNRPATIHYQQPAGQPMVGPQVTVYDAFGRKTSQTDTGGKTTGYTYDCLGRLTSVTLPSTSPVTYTYDGVGNLMSQKDSNNHTTSFTYDVLGRRIKRTLPGGQFETYDLYDSLGNLKHKTDFNGNGKSFNYDNNSRLTSKTFLGGTVSYTYSPTGKRLTLTDGTGITHFTYDPQSDYLTDKQAPAAYGSLHYSPNALGQVTEAKDPSHATLVDTTYGFDADNRPATVTDSGANRTVYSYDNVGNLSNVGLPNSVGVTYQYDTLNRLNTMQTSGTKVGLISQVFSYNYQVGGGGNRLSVQEAPQVGHITGRAVTWGYDDTYKLINETITNDPNAFNGGITLTYDQVGNRQTRTSTVTGIPNQTSNYDLQGKDRLTSDGNTNYFYDANGSVTQAVNIGNSSTTIYQYDGENRLISVSAPGLTESYQYDGDGNKVSQTINGVTTNYLIDTNNLTGYAQVIEEIQGPTIQKSYTYGVSRISQDALVGASYVRSYYGYDGQGSVRFLMDSTGNVTDQYTYTAFGETLSQGGPTSNSFLYDGESQDSNTGLYNLRARWMNPGVGRFQSMDTAAGSAEDPLSFHRYLFVEDDSVNKIDPSGMEAKSGPYGLTLQDASTGVYAQVVGNVIGRLSAAIGLDDENTDLGIVERLFIAEIRNPYYIGRGGTKPIGAYTEPAAVQSMRLLGALVNNRKNGISWPKDIFGVITDPGQFKYFNSYPDLGNENNGGTAAGIIKGVLDTANDSSSSYSSSMKRYITASKNVAGQIAAGSRNDPYNGRTIFMRTAYSSKPSKSSKPLITLMDNTFYEDPNAK